MDHGGTGPQPVSIGMEHLNPYSPNAIMSGYTVTEKADGIFALNY